MSNSLIRLFTQHKVAANLIMAVMLISGIYGLTKINYQYFPTFGVDMILVTTVWQGATAEDVEVSITNIMEQELKNVERIKNLISNSSNSVSSITLEFEEGTDMQKVLDQVKDEVAKVNNLPEDAEEPTTIRLVNYETISKLVVSTDGELEELRDVAYRFERELLASGLGKIEVDGLPEREIAIEVETETALELGMSLSEIGQRVRTMSQDFPAGVVGDEDITRRIRTKEQRRGVSEFEDLVVKADKNGQFLRLGQIAHISEREKKNQVKMIHDGKPAVEIAVRELPGSDSLEAAEKLQTWLKKTRPTLPPSIHITVYNERWKHIKSRLNLLLKNGATGLVFVCLILFFFLNSRVAFWVALGIPASFMATIAILYGIGGSINMISMFALIMALGIIVDDAIVVGEDALSQFQAGKRPTDAAEAGAVRMLAPVISSSLSTIAAFLPLMIVGGIIGKILFDIPLIIICVIIASVVESFFVLPGHLRHAMRNMRHDSIPAFRQKLDDGFNTFRDGIFRRAVVWSVEHKRVVLALTISSLVLGTSLLAGGRLAFSFFPAPEGDMIKASVTFVSGTSQTKVREFTDHMQVALKQTEEELGEELVNMSLVELGFFGDFRAGTNQKGDQFSTVLVEMVPADSRSMLRKDFIAAWSQRIVKPSGLESLDISTIKEGPPGKDLELRLRGDDAVSLKMASQEVVTYLNKVPGVLSIEDDLPYGQEQLIFSLNAEALSLGLTVDYIGAQLRSAYDGYLVQTYMKGKDEIDVRVILPESQRARLSSLESMMVILPNGKSVLLQNLVTYKASRGFDVLRHADGNLAVSVRSDLDDTVIVAADVIAKMQQEILPTVESEYGVQASFEGKNADERQTLSDMRTGLLLALVLMYIILSWVFSSYGWSLVVMSAIPFGLVGALVGHWLLGIDLTILSLFGLFGLSGIVVNDSIVLVSFYKQLRGQGMAIKEAVIEATCQRLRAVLLTSLTTIAGLLPLLFETSRQAQFLIPMAISISFGLAFATFLILFYIPSLLMVYEQIREKFSTKRQVETQHA